MDHDASDAWRRSAANNVRPTGSSPNPTIKGSELDSTYKHVDPPDQEIMILDRKEFLEKQGAQNPDQ